MGGPCAIVDESGKPAGAAPACTDNFQIKPFTLDGEKWSSVEQCFQALKFLEAPKRKSMQDSLPEEGEGDRPYGLRMFQMGRERLPIRADWDVVRAEVMYRVTRAKFASNKDCQEELLATGCKAFGHHDAGFWGVWNPKIMTRLREELRPPEERVPHVLEALEKEFAVQLASGDVGMPLPGLEPLSSATPVMRTLEGYNNSMPGPGAGGGGRGYVILGAPKSWRSPPRIISVQEQTVDVEKETYDFVARGLQLTDGSHAATVFLEDGSEEQTVVVVKTVC